MGGGDKARPGLVLLALGCFAAAVSGQCLLGLGVDQQHSRFTAGGQLIQPLAEPIVVNSTQQMSLSGKLFLSIPSGPCPTTPQNFVQALAGASIVTPADADLLSLQPSAIQAQIGDPALADLTLNGVQFNVSSPVLPAIPANAESSPYGTTLFAQVANGSSSVQLSQNMPIATASGADTSVEMGNMSTNSTVTISVSGRGTAVELTFVKYNFTYTTQFTALGLQGEASYWFAGTIQTSATLGCQQCGVHGLCKLNNGQASCVCDCGFTGPDCSASAPNPACPRNATRHAAKAPALAPAQAAAAPVNPPAPAAGIAAGTGAAAGAAAIPILPSAGSSSGSPPPSPPPSPAISAAGQPQTAAGAGGSSGASGLGGISALSAGAFGPDPNVDPKNGIAVCEHGATAACNTCQAGWQGSNCDACVTDQVCAATLDDSSATCNTGLLYTKKTVYKSYVCDFSSTILSNLLTPQRGYWIECNTTQVRNTQGQEGGFCKVGLRLQAYPDNPIQCVASACQFKEGTGKVQCKDAQCACQQGTCPDGASTYLDMINNKDVSADCDPSTKQCNIQIQGFPIQLQTPCQAGDCISEKNPTLNSGTFAGHSRDYSAVIAAIPIFALVALCLLAIAVSLMGAAFRTAKAIGSPRAITAAKRMPRAPQNPIHLLRFENVTCAVPGSRFNDSHWGNTAMADGRQAGHGRPLASSGPGPDARKADMMEDGAQYKKYENGVFHPEHVQDSARQPLPGQVGHCDYSPECSTEGSDQMREPSLLRRKMLLLSGLRHRFYGNRSRVNIVDNATGQAKMGELVGVLGPSGCGKTTLLSILSGSVSSLSRSSRVYGHITLDGVTRKAWASRLVAYVPQFDFLLPTLTVAETLRYSALLRLPKDTEGAEVQGRVEGVLEELGLQAVAGSQVGGTSGIRGISGGERRRVTIGMELVIDPSILVLDEPTSGLDSFTAVNLMTTLKQVAQAGRIVLLSFHQPSPAMYELLDRVFLMSKGHVVFCGEPGAAYEHFEHAGLPCPSHTAIAEHMLAAVSDPVMSRCLLNHVERKGPYSGMAREEFLEGVSSNSASKQDSAQEWNSSSSLAHKKPPRSPLTRELAVLYKRTFTEIIRNPTLLLMHCIMALVMGLLCGGIFYHISNDIAGAQNRLGAVFFSLVFLALTSLTTVDLLVNERGLVVKESLGGYYRPVSYYLSKATLDGLLLRVLPAVIYSIPFYPMIGFQSDPAHVALFFCVLAVFSATVGALSMAITVGFGTAGKAALIMNLVLLLSLLFTGYLVNIAAVTPVLQWVHYLSVFFFGFESLIVNEMSGISLIFSAAGASITIKGDLFLQLISVRTDMLIRDVAVLDAYFFAFVIAGIALLYLTMPRALVVRRPKNTEGAYTKPAWGVSHATSSSSVGVIDVQHQEDDFGWDRRAPDSHAIDMTPQKETEFTPQKMHSRR